MNVNSFVKNKYFSDHDALNCKYWPKKMMRLTLKGAVNTAAKYNVLWGIMYNCDITL